MRRSRVLGAAALALAIGFGGLTAVPAAAGPTAADDLTIAPPPHQDPARAYVSGAGTGLVMWRDKSYLWRSLQDGREASYAGCQVIYGTDVWSAASGDTVACEKAGSGGAAGPMVLHDFASGTGETLAAPAGRAWTKAFSPSQVLATEVDQVGWVTLHLIGRQNEPRKDVVVTSPDRFGMYAFRVQAFDQKGALVSYLNGKGGETVALVDFATATLRPVPLPDGVTETTHTKFGLGSQWIAMENSHKVTLRSRADGNVTRTVDLFPASVESVQPVGDWLLARVPQGLVAAPVAGGATRTLLPRTGIDPITPGADGSAYVAGGTDSSHWGIHRVAVGPDGAPVVRKVVDLPPNPANRVGLAFAQGGLAVSQEDPQKSVQGYTASVSGTPSVSQTPTWKCDATVNLQLCGLPDSPAARSVATGDGRFVSVSAVDTGDPMCFGCGIALNVIDAGAGGSIRQVPLPYRTRLQPVQVEQASGRYVLFAATENSALRFFVADVDAGRILDAKAVAQSVLWGSTLWAPEGDKGVVAGTDLRTGQVTQRVDLGSGCRPFELKVNGDWFYSTCSSYGDAPAAYHAPTRKRIPLPFTPQPFTVRLGDGYLVHQAGVGLEITNLRSGAPVREPDIAAYVGSFGTGWTIDRFGGRLAYTDAGETVHLVGVAGTASPLAVIDQDTAATVDFKQAKTWQARWWLSKPVSSWKLTVRNKTSGITTVVRTGTEARGLIAPSWDGKSPTGSYLFTGDYEWTLTATPADGRGAAIRTTGSVTVTGVPSAARPPVRR
ncbi:hypothetical protein AB0892_28970 [Streptomyces sp. NPDC005409]|uniref:hypothetical protein n=1 Tax=Streptomyces sp. NPDC005409 TaxID=3155342 RepID=UPI0034555A9A